MLDQTSHEVKHSIDLLNMSLVTPCVRFISVGVYGLCKFRGNSYSLNWKSFSLITVITYLSSIFIGSVQGYGIQYIMLLPAGMNKISHDLKR